MRNVFKYLRFILLALLLIFFIAWISVLIPLSSNWRSLLPTSVGELQNEIGFIPNDFFHLTNFWVSYLQMDNFIKVMNNSTWSFYVIDSYCLLPLLVVVTFLLVGFWGFNGLIKKKRRVEIKKDFITLSLFFRIFLILTILFFLIGFIIVEAYEKKALNSNFNDLYGDASTFITINGDEAIYNDGSNNIIVLLDSVHLIGILLSKGDFWNSSITSSMFIAGGSILIIVLPILAITTLWLLLFYLIHRSLLLEYGLPVNPNWQKTKQKFSYSNIASRKEVIQRFFSKIGLLIMIPIFLVFMIIPSWFPEYFDRYRIQNIIVMIFSIVIIFLAFIPSYFILFKVSAMKPAKYNLFIYLQMVTLVSVGFIWQMLIWIVLDSNYLFYDYVPIIFFGLYIGLSYFAYILFLTK